MPCLWSQLLLRWVLGEAGGGGAGGRGQQLLLGYTSEGMMPEAEQFLHSHSQQALSQHCWYC